MNPPLKHIVKPGDQFGRLRVVSEDRVYRGSGRTERAALCVCECNSITVIELTKLFSGHTSSCGCLHREMVGQMGHDLAPRRRTHGLSKHALYSTYKGMMNRCYSEDSPDYYLYGARGIRVYAGWHDVRTFIEDIERDIGSRPPGRTLDRKDNNSDYAPGKVRWATPSEQARNRRHPRKRDSSGRFIETSPN